MRWLTTAALLVFGIGIGSVHLSEVTEACKAVHRESLYRIKCSYSVPLKQWILRFKWGAYRITRASGRHPALIEHLCFVAGTSVLEVVGDLEHVTICEI